MKIFKVSIEFVGLTGTYLSKFEVKARTQASAEKKAYQVVGDRSYNFVNVEAK